MNRPTQWLFEVLPAPAPPKMALDNSEFELAFEWEASVASSRAAPGSAQLRPPGVSGSLPIPACPLVNLREVVSGFPRYQQSLQSLPPIEQAKINRLAHLVVRSYNPGCQPIRTIRLIGHADRDLQRGAQFERKISGDRAQTMRIALSRAIDRLGRLIGRSPTMPPFSAQLAWQSVAMGATQLRITNPRTEAERTQNRRVEVLLSSAQATQTEQFVEAEAPNRLPRRKPRRPRPTPPPSPVPLTLTPQQQVALTTLQPLTPKSTLPTVDNELAIMRSLCQFHSLPLSVPYVILQHECGAGNRCLKHPDGVMQTTSGARQQAIATIPRSLKLTLLGLPLTDASTEAVLSTRLRAEFAHRLAVQIATGVQVLVNHLRAFNGYVALAYIAYNAGPGWANHVATRGRSKQRPNGINDAQWEEMCKYAASLLHKPPSSLEIGNGRWQCDKNIPTWFKTLPVRDPQENITLVAYQYLRSIRECVHPQKPQVACNATNHGKREDGSGKLVCTNSRTGALDKLYSPILLGSAFFNPAQPELPQIPQDELPLKVLGNGKLVKMALMSGSP